MTEISLLIPIFNVEKTITQVINRLINLMNNIPYYTTIAGAKIAVDAIENLKKNNLSVRSLQSIH